MSRDSVASRIFTTWERMAPGWERRRERTWEVSEHVGRQLVEAAGPKPGEVVLELAAGVGETGFLAAPLVQPGGHVISSDFSPAMVEVAKRRAVELGVDGVEFRVLDAQALDLPDWHVDVVLCRWGLMLMPDPAAALHEARRVVRPGGRLAFSVWGPPDGNPWAATVARVLVDAGHMEPAGAGRPGIFALADRERLEALVTEAGFERPEITEIPMRWKFDSFDDYWGFTLDKAGALAMVIEGLPEAEQTTMRESVRTKLGSTASGSFELDGLSLNALTRPTRAD